MCAQICLYPVSGHSVMQVRSSPVGWKGLGLEISLWLCLCAWSHQSCPTVCDPGLELPGSWVRGILQARILEWAAVPSSSGSPDPGIKPASPVSSALEADSLPLSHWGSRLTVSLLLHNRVNLEKWFHPAELSFSPGEWYPDICFAPWFLKSEIIVA